MGVAVFNHTIVIKRPEKLTYCALITSVAYLLVSVFEIIAYDSSGQVFLG